MIRKATRSFVPRPCTATWRATKHSIHVANKSRLRRYTRPRALKTSKLFPPPFGLEETAFDILDKKYDIESYASAYDTVEEAPDGYWAERIVGRIPEELQGTYFRNGPGQFDFVNEPVAHGWDANGIIGSVAIKDGRAFFRSKFVKTRESMLEEREGRRLFRGGFGTIPKHGLSPFRLMRGRNAATGKTFFGNGKLYAPYEGSQVVEVDPYSLDTIYPKLPETPLAAIKEYLIFPFQYLNSYHSALMQRVTGSRKCIDPRQLWGIADSKYDPRRNVTICHSYGLKPIKSGSGMEFKIYEFDSQCNLFGEQRYSIDSCSMGHSIGVSENYYVINRFPMGFDAEDAMDPTLGLVQCLKWNAYGSHEFHFVPRPQVSKQAPLKETRVFKLCGTSFIYHFVNVFEEDDKVIVDAIHYPRKPAYEYGPDSGQSYKVQNSLYKPEPRLRRTVCFANGRVETQEISTRCIELPNINPQCLGRRYRFLYSQVSLHPSAHVEPQALAKIDLDTGEMKIWSNGRHYFAGEPFFVPRPGATDEDDGWILAFCYNGHSRKSEFVILNAGEIDAGPIATVFLDHAVAHGFHGVWSTKFFGADACALNVEQTTNCNHLFGLSGTPRITWPVTPAYLCELDVHLNYELHLVGLSETPRITWPVFNMGSVSVLHIRLKDDEVLLFKTNCFTHALFCLNTTGERTNRHLSEAANVPTFTSVVVWNSKEP